MSTPTLIDSFRGDHTGLTVPAHVDALHTAGASFLTEAFRAFGAIAPDNAVTQIVSLEHCPGGCTGAKLFMTVEYARPDPDLHTELFVKFSRDFADAFRDRRRQELEAEVRLATLSRRPTADESERLVAHVQKAGDPRKGYGDIVWAVLNSSEFTLNH